MPWPARGVRGNAETRDGLSSGGKIGTEPLRIGFSVFSYRHDYCGSTVEYRQWSIDSGVSTYYSTTARMCVSPGPRYMYCVGASYRYSNILISVQGKRDCAFDQSCLSGVFEYGRYLPHYPMGESYASLLATRPFSAL